MTVNILHDSKLITMIQDINSLISRGVAEIIIKQELMSLLETGRPLRLKQGFDPSRPDIHLGHVVGLRKLRQFQKMGHKVVLIVGDWTAQIGDPSGASVTRPMLTHNEVKANAETYMKQFFKVVDKEKTEVRWQSEWFGNFNLGDIFKLTSKFTVAQFLARDDFNKRFHQNKPIAITEFLYPLLQAYDSVAVQSDVEFGGTDQKFNCLVGRELQTMMGQKPQQIMLLPLLVGTDGKEKMSKSLGNYIGVDESPGQIYGKTMSITDDLILDYFALLTDIPDEELETIGKDLKEGKLNPMLSKKRLALIITAQFHSQQAAVEAQKEFEQVFQRHKPPETIEVYIVSKEEQNLWVNGDMADVIAGTALASSRSEAKRLIAQGAVEIDGVSFSDLKEDKKKIKDGSVIKVGPRRFKKIIFNQSDIT